MKDDKQQSENKIVKNTNLDAKSTYSESESVHSGEGNFLNDHDEKKTDSNKIKENNKTFCEELDFCK